MQLRAALVGPLVTWSLVSCSPEGVRSKSQEGIDSNNKFTLFGYSGAPTWDDIKTIDSVKSDRLPWTDTYWPLTQKGLSNRWDTDATANEKDPKIWPSDYFRRHVEASLSSFNIDPLLSPAEKYDLVFRWKHDKPLSWEPLRKALDAMNALEEKILASDSLEEKRGLVANLRQEMQANHGETFRTLFPMTSDGWRTWLDYNSQSTYSFVGEKDSGDDWSWMGSCHGWAPAALMAETPRHAVRVRIGLQQVLFTEGDIRGLLTKSWADHSPNNKQYFVGRRCNKNTNEPTGDIPAGEDGRGSYGMMQVTPEQPERGFYVKAEYFAAFTGPGERIYPITFADESSVGFILERYNQPTNSFSYSYATDLSSLQQYKASGDLSHVLLPSRVELYGCWDVNPATFHMALLEKVGEGKQGMVIDRTRTGQVWNQPVYQAKFTFSDEMQASAVADSAAAYRAPGTKYLVAVTADVKWMSEPNKAQMVYDSSFDRRYLVTTRYHYSLEFDRAHRLIGGEWGELEKINPKEATPDFFFGFDEGALPVDRIDQGFDYSGIVAKIHACSLSEDTDGTTKVRDMEIEYKDCSLDR